MKNEDKTKEELIKELAQLRQRVAELEKSDTERKLAQEALGESERQYRCLVESTPDWVWCIDIEGRVTFTNEAVKHLLGYEVHEILSSSSFSSIHPEDRERFQKLYQGSVAQKRGWKNEVIRCLHKDGSVRLFESIAQPILDAEGHLIGFSGIDRDITERKRLEAQLLQAQKMEAVGTLAGGVAHDFNNLLHAVQGYAEILLLGKDRNEAGCQELREITRAAKRGAELTQQLLTFSRKVESKLRPVDLNLEVEKTTKLLERTIPKMIEIELRLAGDLKVVNGDPAQVEQILVNLAVNAKDAMPEGGKLIIQTENVMLDEEYSRTGAGAKRGEYVSLTVSDTGRGMDKETLEHIFDPFFTTQGLAKRSGLGLSMAYGIVKNHGGYIECSSGLGVGTTFKVYLPVVEQEVEPEKAAEADKPKGGTETILLVDDEEFIRGIGRQTLARFGYTVLTASDGESALELCCKEQDRIDLIILDLIMPGMSGKRCLEELLRVNPQAKVIIASGYSDIGCIKETIEAGAKAFICKPYEVRQILGVVREVLDEG